MRRALLVCVLLAGVALQGEPCIESIELLPRAAVLQRPQARLTYSVRVRVRQHPEHRRLELTWFEVGLKAGRSVRQREGDAAPVTFTFPVRDQVAGRYRYIATVFDDRGQAVGQARTETVLVGDEDSSKY